MPLFKKLNAWTIVKLFDLNNNNMLCIAFFSYIFKTFFKKS